MNINFNIKGFSFNDNGTNVNLDELALSTDISAEDMKTSGETLNKSLPLVGSIVKEILVQQNQFNANEAEARRKSEKELEEMRERNARLNRIDNDTRFRTIENRTKTTEENVNNLIKDFVATKDFASKEINGIRTAVEHVAGIREKIAGISNDNDRK